MAREGRLSLWTWFLTPHECLLSVLTEPGLQAFGQDIPLNLSSLPVPPRPSLCAARPCDVYVKRMCGRESFNQAAEIWSQGLSEWAVQHWPYSPTSPIIPSCEEMWYHLLTACQMPLKSDLSMDHFSMEWQCLLQVWTTLWVHTGMLWFGCSGGVLFLHVTPGFNRSPTDHYQVAHFWGT